VCDQGKNNTKAVNLSLATKDKPFLSVDIHKIFVIYDVPHLIKSVRNNLLNGDIHFDNGKASWRHVSDLYKIDATSLKARSLCKITEKHIEPNSFDRMKVSLATQVFSRSVKAAMLTAVDTNQLPQEAVQTAQFVGELNDIFDCLNSRLLIDPNPLKCGISSVTTQGKQVIQKLQSTVFWIQSWRKVVIKESKEKRRVIETRPPCFCGFELTINAVLQLWEEMSKENNISFLLTNHLNQDAIEHEFSICRHKGGYTKNPTALQFRQNLRHRIQVVLMTPPHSGNCEVDAAEEIPTLTVEREKDIQGISDTEEENESENVETDYSQEDCVPEEPDEEYECDDDLTQDSQRLDNADQVALTPIEVSATHDQETAPSTLESCSVQ